MQCLGRVDENTLFGKTKIERATVVDSTPTVVAAGQRTDLQISIGGRAAFKNGVRGINFRKSVGERHQIRLEVLIREGDHVDRRRHRQIRTIEQAGAHLALCRHEIDGGRLHGHAITSGILGRRGGVFGGI